jgi:hypothetical protein
MTDLTPLSIPDNVLPVTTTQFPAEVVLRSGRIAHVDADRRATLATCPWFVQVPSHHPEPDSEADCWLTVDCGAPLFAIDGDIDAGWHCAHGHRHLAYGSPAQQAEERLEAEVELAASHDPRIAARLDAGEPWQSVLHS